LKLTFVGQNGQGKSTFIKAIVNEWIWRRYKVRADVQVGYFWIKAEYLDGEITLLQTMEDAAYRYKDSKCAIILVHSSFIGDDVEKR
jgi:ATP-binding cassette subfamily F protein 3